MISADVPRKNTNSAVTRSKALQVKLSVPGSDEEIFAEVVRLIGASRGKAVQAVNASLIELYWEIGSMISRKIKAAEWGDGVVERLAEFIARTESGLRGFTRRNLFRMRQFYEAYVSDSIVSPLVTQLPWTHHLIILGQSKRPEERGFYVRMAIQEKWSKRELERQFNTALFERVVLSPPRVSPVVTQMYPEALSERPKSDRWTQGRQSLRSPFSKLSGSFQRRICNRIVLGVGRSPTVRLFVGGFLLLPTRD